jgi:hypothetical protein
MGKWNATGYSADVRLWLVCGDRRIRLSHASSTFVVAADPTDLPPGHARIEFTIDGEQFERAVTLPGGMSSDRREVAV